MGGIPLSGTGAYAMPVNEGRLRVQVGVRKCGVGAPWSNGCINQPDSNYTPQIKPSWATDYTFQTYPDHFFITFTNPAPSDAYFDWMIAR